MHNRPAISVQIRHVLDGADGWLSANQVHDALAVRGIVTDVCKVRQRLAEGANAGEVLREGKVGAYVYRLNRAWRPTYRVPKRKTEPARPFSHEPSLPLRIRLEALQGDLLDIREQAAHQRASMDVCLGIESVQRGVDRVLRELR